MKTNFIVAIKKGRLNSVRAKHEYVDPDISHEKCSGKSLYTLAIERRNLPMLALLHELTNVSVDVFDLDGVECPLSSCVRAEFIEGMEFLLQKGANINLLNVEGESPFHIAAQCGSPRLLQYLIKKGAMPDLLSINGQAIHIAARHNNQAAYEYLKNLSGVDWKHCQQPIVKRDKLKRAVQEKRLLKELRPRRESSRRRDAELLKESMQREKGMEEQKPAKKTNGLATFLTGGAAFLLGMSGLFLCRQFIS